jgi:hypothetical protein
VPPWGRPPGAKGSKRRRQWEREQDLWQQEQSRVEELDSDDTDTQGVDLNYEKKRFSSDPLHFTGIDLSSSSRNRQGYTYDDSDDSSDSDSGYAEEEGTNALQVALRNKEEALVQSALARIRRAQEKGKREVKLNQDELDALEKRRKRMRAAATIKERQGSGSGSERERRRRNDRQLVTVPIEDPKGRKKGKARRSDTPPVPPGIIIPGSENITYAPLGYYPPQAGPSRTSPSRPRSSTSQQLRGAPPQYAHQNPRHFSEGARPTSSSSNGSRRILPDEEDWQPSRRSSTSSGPVDPFDYQIDPGHPPPIPQQYAAPRRPISEVAYSSVRRSPPIGQHAYPSLARGSDPSLRRQSSHRTDEADSLASTSEEDDSDELGNGVQVFVEEDRIPERERSIMRKPVGRKKGKGR